MFDSEKWWVCWRKFAKIEYLFWNKDGENCSGNQNIRIGEILSTRYDNRFGHRGCTVKLLRIITFCFVQCQFDTSKSCHIHIILITLVDESRILQCTWRSDILIPWSFFYNDNGSVRTLLGLHYEHFKEWELSSF